MPRTGNRGPGDSFLTWWTLDMCGLGMIVVVAATGPGRPDGDAHRPSPAQHVNTQRGSSHHGGLRGRLNGVVDRRTCSGNSDVGRHAMTALDDRSVDPTGEHRVTTGPIMGSTKVHR